LLDDDETAILAGQVELRTFVPRQRIYKIGDPGERAYVMVSEWSVSPRWTKTSRKWWSTSRPIGEFFGFCFDARADSTPDQCGSHWKETVCLEVDRHDIANALAAKTACGMDMLTVLGRQFHASSNWCALRAMRNANEIIEQEATSENESPDVVAGFGGS